MDDHAVADLIAGWGLFDQAHSLFLFQEYLNKTFCMQSKISDELFDSRSLKIHRNFESLNSIWIQIKKIIKLINPDVQNIDNEFNVIYSSL